MITEQEARDYFLAQFAAALTKTGRRAINYVEGHSARVAAAARKIAEQMRANGVCEVEPAEAYVAGLLHDIGKSTEGWEGLKHVVAGYDKLMADGLEVPARIAMTHTWYGYNEIPREDFWRRMDKAEARRVRDFMDTHEMTDLDRLIQLVDNMAAYNGVMTVSDRFADILLRHDLADAGAHLRELYKLKSYFDEKCGMNIYELFKSDIIETTMQEPNNNGEYNFNWRKDEIQSR